LVNNEREGRKDVPLWPKLKTVRVREKSHYENNHKLRYIETLLQIP